jgi:glucokinase
MNNAKTQFAGPRTRSGFELPTPSCALLELLREKDFKSIEEARRVSGLSSPQFAASVRLLEKKKLVEVNAGVRSGRGTRSTTLRIRGGRGYVAAVDIGGTNLRLVIADMTGTIVGKWSGSTVGASSPERVARLIQSGVQHVVRRTGLRRDALLAIAAGAPGVTDSRSGVVRLTSYLGGWKDVPLGRLLEKALGVPAAIENDVRLGAVGERWRGSGRGIGDFVFIAIGTGIAAGIFLNGELLYGQDFAAGEVGYLIVPGTPEVGVQAGAPGALESAIGGEGIRAQWQELVQRLYGEAPHSLTATDIFERALTGDEQAKNVLERSARILAYAVYNIAVVLNCSLFILGGGVGMSAILRDATARVLESYSEPVRPKLRLSSLGPDAQLFGALRLALDAAEKRIGIRT